MCLSCPFLGERDHVAHLDLFKKQNHSRFGRQLKNPSLGHSLPPNPSDTSPSLHSDQSIINFFLCYMIQSNQRTSLIPFTYDITQLSISFRIQMQFCN